MFQMQKKKLLSVCQTNCYRSFGFRFSESLQILLFEGFFRMKGEIMFDNTLTIVVSHHCIFTEVLPRLNHRSFRLLSSLPRLRFSSHRGNHVQQRRGFTACKWSNSFKRYCATMATGQLHKKGLLISVFAFNLKNQDSNLPLLLLLQIQVQLEFLREAFLKSMLTKIILLSFFVKHQAPST